MKNHIENQPYFYIFVLVVIGLGLSILWPVKDLLLLSWVVVTLFLPIYQFLLKKLKFPKMLATLSAMLTVIFTILVPLSILVNVSISQFQVFYRDINDFLNGGTSAYDMVVNMFDSVNAVLARIPYFEYRLSVENMKMLIQQNIAPVANYVLSYSVDVGVSFAKSFPLVIIFLYLIWYGFPEHDRFVKFLKNISPLSDKLDDLYLSRITAMIVGIAKGTLVIAFIQGCIAGLSLLITGVPYVFFWTMVMIFFSIIPLGAGFVTIPVALIMLVTGNVWQATFILIIQFLIISNVDNVLKPMLVPKEAEVHPVLLLLSIIGGIQVFGVWGFIYGPLIMVIFLTTVEVYQKYYKLSV